MIKSIALILGVLVFLAGAAVARLFRRDPAPPAQAPAASRPLMGAR